MIVKKCDICGAENATTVTLSLGLEQTERTGDSDREIVETYELCAEHMVQAWAVAEAEVNVNDSFLYRANQSVANWIIENSFNKIFHKNART